MRPRKKPNLIPRLEACQGLLLEGKEAGEIRKAFPDTSVPLHMEIGCGKGGFICEKARQMPEIHFLAMEREANVIISALEMAQTMGLSNLRFLLGDADDLLKILFQPGEIACFYINFCDPWPKKRHAKRRLTHRSRLTLYQELLAPAGELHFKTDNQGLYEFSLEEFQAVFPPYFTTCDLHNSEYAPGNIMTEYEHRFSDLGQPIYSIRAQK